MADAGGPHSQHLHAWLRGGSSGCRFATAARVTYSEWSAELTAENVLSVESFIDGTGRDETFAIIPFPQVRTTSGVVRILQALATGERWTLVNVPWKKHEREGVGLVGLQFRTADGDQTSVMGLSPFGEMPVTRRAPYVALVVWGGQKLNSHTAKFSRPGKIGFVDASVVDPRRVPVDGDVHEKMWQSTRESVEALFADPAEDALRLKDVAFCLPAADLVELFPT